jgi:hypothetical protein
MHAIFVSYVDILHAFHSIRCTMPKFIMPPLHTTMLHAPLTKLSHDNIYPHRACIKKTPMRSTNTMHTTCTIIMFVHSACTLLCICTQHNAKFSVQTHTPTFFRVEKKFSARTYTQTYFCATPKFSVHTCTPTFFRAAEKFSACNWTPTFFCAVPNLVHAPAHQHFYISQVVYYTSCIFSVPTCAHSFLCASIP